MFISASLWRKSQKKIKRNIQNIIISKWNIILYYCTILVIINSGSAKICAPISKQKSAGLAI